jgi:MinD-like ATPase involved in chromosome partitioning or flagellar assembly
MLALTPPVEQTIESLLFGDRAAVRVAATIDEPAALDRVVGGAGDVEALLVSADLPGLTPALLARARAHGLRLVGISTSDRDAVCLAGLSLDTVLTLPLEAPALERALRPSARPPRAARPDGARTAPPRVAREAGRRRGTVVAIVGGRRSPGASELAASVAALASLRWRTLLVELDLGGGGLALRLGADAGQGSVSGLLRAADGERSLDELIERWLLAPPGWPPTLLAPVDANQVGVALGRPGVVAAAIEGLAAGYPLVVADAGPPLGRPGEVDPIERCHRETLLTADAVVLVLGAREAQLEAGLAQLDLLLDDLGVAPERLRVVCNAVGCPGAIPRLELEQVVAATLLVRGMAVDAFLPWDARGLARGTRTGLPLAVARPRGSYSRAARALLESLFLPAAPVARGRKRLLPAPGESAPSSPTERPMGTRGE